MDKLKKVRGDMDLRSGCPNIQHERNTTVLDVLNVEVRVK